MSSQPNLDSDQIPSCYNKELIDFPLVYRMLEEYKKVLDALNKLSAHTQQMRSDLGEQPTPES